MNKMSVLPLFVCFFTIFTASVFAGSDGQKAVLTEIVNNSKYVNLFEYYQKKSLFFSPVKCIDKNSNEITIPSDDNNEELSCEEFANTTEIRLLDDVQALSELYSLFSDIQTVRRLPYYISDDAREFWDGFEVRLETEFPKAIENALWKTALEMGDSGWGALGKTEGVKLIFNAALTGPNVGLDIISGGFSKIGKGIVKGTKLIKKVKVIKHIKKIDKLLEAKQLKKITSALLKVDIKLAKKLKLTSKEATRIFNIFGSDGFKLFVKMTNRTLDKVIFLENFTSNEQDVINKYIAEHQNDEVDYIAQYFVTSTLDNTIDFVELAEKANMAIYIQLFQTGLLSLMAQEEGIEIDQVLIKAAIDISLKAAEFVPIAGPFFELANANAAALSTIRKNQKESILAAESYGKYRRDYIDLELVFYKMMVLEGIVQAITNNDTTVKDSLRIKEFFGVPASINNIAGAIIDGANDKELPKNIYDDLYSCRVAHVDKFKDITTVTNASKEINSKAKTLCSVKGGYFTAEVQMQRGNLDSSHDFKSEIYITLKDNKLYKLAAKSEFLDVLPGSYYYPYIKLLAFQYKINTQTDYFYPNKALTQLEFAVLVTNIFYQDSFYSNTHSSLNEQQRYYDFLNEKISWTADISNKDKSVTKAYVANTLYDVFQKEFSLALNNTNKLNGSMQGWRINNRVYQGNIDNHNGWSFAPLFLKSIGIPDTKGDVFKGDEIITRGDSISFLYKANVFMEENK